MFTSVKKITEKFRLRFGKNKSIDKVSYIGLCFSLFLYVFSIPSFSGRVGLNILSYAFFGVLCLFLIIRILLYGLVKMNRLTFLILLFSVYCFIPTILFSHEFRGCLSVLLLTITMLVMFMSFEIIHEKRIVLLILNLAILAFGFYFIFYYWDKGLLKFSEIGTEKNRLGSYFNNVNWVATFLMVGVIISLILLLTSKRWIGSLNVIPFVLFSYLGFSTGSRTFMLGLLIVIVSCLFIRFKSNKIALIILFAFFVSFFILFLTLPVFSQLRSRFESFLSGASTLDVSSAERYQWMIDGFYYGMRNPFIGYGYYGFSHISGVGTYTHSNFTELLCNYGIFFTGLFYYPIFYLIVKYFRNKHDSYSKYSIVISILYILYSFLTVFYANKIYYVLIALAMFLDGGNATIKNYNANKTTGELLYYFEI